VCFLYLGIHELKIKIKQQTNINKLVNHLVIIVTKVKLIS